MPEPLSAQPLTLSETLNSLPMGYMVIDLEGQVLEANNHVAALLGLSVANLVGLDVASFWPDSAPELLKVAKSGRQAAGLILPEISGCWLLTNPLAGGRPGLAITVFDQRLWHPLMGPTPLDPLTPYYKKIFESSSDGISICDAQARLILVNRASAEHLGVTPEQIQGRHVSFLVQHRLLDNTVCLDVLKAKKPVTKLIKHFKTNKQVLLTGNPIFSPDGEVHLVVINERDLTGMMELQSDFNRQSEQLDRLKDQLATIELAELAANDIVAVSPSMRLLLDSALKLARYGVREVLLTGESGTGKGLIAKFLHANSKNSKEPFIHLNCAALPETLLETELFGYDKGVFTGAAPKGRAGLIEAAGRGAVFLDEIGEMPLSIQAKLLTFLDNHEFRRVGGRAVMTSPCAVIAATNRNLEDLVAEKLFRQDLYYRLNVFGLHIPPLRERPEDTLELARREIADLNRRYDQSLTLDPLAVKVLQGHTFPGNVRELLNCLHQAALLSSDRQVGPFLKTLFESRRRSEPPDASPASATAKTASRPAEGGPPALSTELDRAERTLLEETVKACRSTREMAVRLGISQAGVSRRLKKHNLLPPTRNGGSGRSARRRRQNPPKP
ncbi:MAG: sigma 54-interacting transcriptional regulator [Deltaproteobacteria bacterium]|jgi:PAS domain S-box-containing protein|nr:sigma 54-interacting transcriptional regulator [Deltaproteobacteria bacterium]